MTEGGAVTISVRRAIATALLATAIVGGTAAAAEMFDGHLEEPIVEEPTTTLAPDGTTTTLPGEEGEEIEEPEGDGEEADGVERYYEGCGDFTEGNHGKYVSEAARADDREGSMKEAAQSPCGKPVSSVHTEPEEPVEEPVTEPEPDTSATQGQGHGKGGARGSSGSAPGQAKKH
jgi:hypothetical protein